MDLELDKGDYMSDKRIIVIEHCSDCPNKEVTCNNWICSVKFYYHGSIDDQIKYDAPIPSWCPLEKKG